MKNETLPDYRIEYNPFSASDLWLILVLAILTIATIISAPLYLAPIANLFLVALVISATGLKIFTLLKNKSRGSQVVFINPVGKWTSPFDNIQGVHCADGQIMPSSYVLPFACYLIVSDNITGRRQKLVIYNDQISAQSLARIRRIIYRLRLYRS